MDSISKNILMSSSEFQQEIHYWKEKLSEEFEIGKFSLGNQNSEKFLYKSECLNYKFSSNLFGLIQKTTKGSDYAVFMILLSGIFCALNRYEGNKNYIIGMPVFNNIFNDKLINSMLALSCFVQLDSTFRDLLIQIKECVTYADKNQNIPFDIISNFLGVENFDEKQSIFGVVALLKNIHDKKNIDGINYPIKFIFNISESLDLEIEYNSLEYKSETIIKIVEYLEKLYLYLLRNPDIKLNDMEVFSASDDEKKIILEEFNSTYANYPKEKTIHELFEDQVIRTPHNIAVVFGENSLTYKELNERANGLALILREKEVGKDVIVGIIAERSIEMIVGILAILKAGGGYLPIDPEYPKDRVKYMIEDSNTKIVLFQDNFDTNLLTQIEFINLSESLFKKEEQNIGKTSCPKDIAYIIYTSGTTGNPKGAIIEHKNVVSLMVNDQMLFNFNENDIWTMFHSFCFDFSVWEMYGALLYGGKLIIIPKIISKDPIVYLKLLKEAQVTVLNQTPTAFYSLMNEELHSEDKNLSLRYVIFGGEALKPSILKDWKLKYPDVKLINMYGITETTVHVTYKEITEKEIELGISNIGKPIPTLRTYIMDDKLNLLPIGAIGELCVGGFGVCRGYLNRTELTNERFVENKYINNEIIYRSGDLARFLPNGDLEYYGRKDNQVKVRGHRIELAEIENKLLSYKDIKETVVVVKNDLYESKYLCAYIVANREISVEEIREFLSVVLPEYMIPSYYVQIEKIPLNSNGKVDKKSLPEQINMNIGGEYIAPSCEVEEKLTLLWSEILHVEKVGILDNFFILGGHSLKAVTLAMRIFKEFNVELNLSEIFKLQTIQEMSRYIKNAEKKKFEAIELVEKKEFYKASAAQKRMYILNKIEGGSVAYNMPLTLIVEGVIEIEKIEKTLLELIKRHETLRTSFHMKEGEVVQKIHEEVEFNLSLEILSDKTLENFVRDFLRPFNLEKAPLFRIGLVKLNEEKHLMLFDMHHIISDGTSMGILVKEFVSLYEGKALPEIRVQYKDYSLWQEKQNICDSLKRQKEYWMNVFDGEIPMLNMPLDFARPTVQSFEGSREVFSISSTLTKKLNNLALSEEVTLYMLLLASFTSLLYRYTGQEDIIIGTPIAGRQHADVQGLIGMFVNTIAMRNYPVGTDLFIDYLNKVKVNTINAFENQNYQFEDLVENISVKRDGSRNPLFDIMFVLQNMEFEDIHIEGTKFSQYNCENNISKFDMSLFSSEVNGQINFELEYCTKLFKKDTIKRFIKHFINFLNSIVQNPMKEIDEIEILDKDERTCLHKFNDTNEDYQKDKTINTLFEDQVLKTPNKIALVFENSKITYIELNNKTNQLANILIEQGAGQGNVIGLMLDRSIEMIIGIIAILKAGCAYLPIDSEYPNERIKYMLSDCKINILLTQQSIQKGYDFDGIVIELDNDNLYSKDNKFHFKTPYQINDRVNHNLISNISHSDLVYVIYTSGSTGKPKGVMINHKNVVNLLQFEYEKTNVNFTGKVLQFASISFDVSFQEIFSTLLNGGELHIIKKEKRNDIQELLKYIENENIEVLFLPPAYLRFISREVKYLRMLSKSVKHIITAGEQLVILDDLKKYLHENKVYLHNHYGPSETHVVTTYTIDFECEIPSLPPIGKPISNTKIYIMNNKMQLQPIGISGELYISGECVGSGYINNSNLTDDKFIKDPFIEENIMYKTGDLARWLPDGNIEYLGRVDNQVKIRGFRIEVGEIENKLLELCGIKEVVVVAKEDECGEKYLCAYFTSEEEFTQGQIREELEKNLPEFMIPSYFVKLENMPKTSNGKMGLKELPQPDKNIIVGTKYEKPTTQMEEKLVDIWRNSLGIEKIGIDDNFFDLGGHSLKAVSIVELAKKENINISVSEIFRYRTIRQIFKNKKDEKNNYSDNILKECTWKNGKILKYIPQKNLTSYLFRSLPLGIVFAQDNLQNWYNNHFIQLCSQTCDDGLKVVDYAESYYVYYEVINHVDVGYDELNETNIVDFIIDKINNENYIIICLDEYYLSQKKSYQKEHFVHELIIYGYDNTERKFIAYGFNKDQLMDVLILSYEDVFNAFESGKSHYLTSAPYAKDHVVQILSVIHDVKFEFNIDLFKKELNDYIFSIGVDRKISVPVGIKDKTIEYINGLRYEYISADRVKYGIDIYDDVIETLENIMKGNMYFDYRMFHILAEHKIGIKERLEFISSTYDLGTDFAIFIEEYKQMVYCLEKVRIKAFEAMHANDFTQDDYVRLIMKVISDIKIIKREEKEILSYILSYL